MATQYVFTIYDETGVAQGIATPLDFAIVHRVNTPSLLRVRLDLRTALVASLEYGWYIKVVRSDPAEGMNAYTEFIGAIRGWKRIYGANPIIEVTAMDAKRILQDRIVAWWPALLGASFFKTSAYPTASSIMTALWNTNVGSGANGNPPVFNANLLRRYGTSLNRWTDGRVSTAVNAVNLSIGNAIEVSCSGENLLTTMQKVADVGSLDFDVLFDLSTFSYTLYYADTLGADRTSYVKMSQANNTIGTLQRSTSRVTSPTYTVAIGYGKCKARITGNYPPTAPTGTDLRESMATGGDATSEAQLTSVARRRYVQEQRKINAWTIEVLQSAMWKYGRDYFLGDLVKIYVSSISSLTRKIYGVSLSMNAQGAEEVRIDLANP